MIVYVKEAHPIDGWRMDVPGQIQLNQPKQFLERVECAKHLKSVISTESFPLSFPLRIVIDQMDNQLSELFAAFPERLVVVTDGIVKFIGGKGPHDYSLDDLEQFLNKLM